jgi:hypothetical protein
MKFQDLVLGQAGLVDAVLDQWETLSQDQEFLDSLYLDHWLAIYSRASVDSQPQLVAFRRIQDLTQGLSQLIQVYRLVPRKSPLQRWILQKFKERVHGFDEWFEVYERAPYRSQLWYMALRKTKQLIHR